MEIFIKLDSHRYPNLRKEANDLPNKKIFYFDSGSEGYYYFISIFSANYVRESSGLPGSFVHPTLAGWCKQGRGSHRPERAGRIHVVITIWESLIIIQAGVMKTRPQKLGQNVERKLMKTYLGYAWYYCIKWHRNNAIRLLLSLTRREQPGAFSECTFQ